MEGDPLNLWLEQIGGCCPKCRKHIHEAPDGRCPWCTQRLVLSLGARRHDAAAWYTGVIALAVSLSISLFPLVAAIAVMALEGKITEIPFFLATLAAFLVVLAALVTWFKIRNVMRRLPAWIAWTLAIACAVPVCGLFGLFLWVTII